MSAYPWRAAAVDRGRRFGLVPEGHAQRHPAGCDDAPEGAGPAGGSEASSAASRGERCFPSHGRQGRDDYIAAAPPCGRQYVADGEADLEPSTEMLVRMAGVGRALAWSRRL